jgi:Ribbon-helix-helix protein, copG family
MSTSRGARRNGQRGRPNGASLVASAMVQVNVRVEPSLYAEAKRLAKREKLTMSAVITAALRDYVRGQQ